MSVSSAPLLEIHDMSVEFHSYSSGTLHTTRAIKNISLTLHRGTTIGIVGESGSGKSVTSLTIMRLLQAPLAHIASGTMIYHSPHGEPIALHTASDAIMRTLRGNKIAMIFQEPMTSLNPLMRCGDQVIESMMLHQGISYSEAREATRQLFMEVRLPQPEDMLDRFPHQLSGGQRQRVMIAIALSCNPDILIADEPTTALDVTVQKTILELIRDIQKKRGMSILFITHDLGVIAEIADSIAVMYRGSLVEYGSAQSILQTPQHPYTKGLLACRPRLDMPKGITLPTVRDFMEELTDGSIVEKKGSRQSYITEDVSLPIRQEPILQVEHLSVHYAQRSGFSLQRLLSRSTAHPPIKAVDDISFTLHRGETLGLVGESGCGKTTTGRAILRLIQPTNGRILFNGAEILRLDASAMKQLRRNMQIIFQDPYSALNPRMSIGSAIHEVLTVHGLHTNSRTRKDAVCAMLEKVGLHADHYTRYPHEFSGGQRQRICIARALIVEPQLLICDESVSALDVSVQAQILNLLADIRREMNLSCIFISHDLSVVKFISNRIAVMRQGAIVEINDAEEIYRNPQNEYTRHLISAIPAIR
jgi:peptide/nickel transport system ATP-binding protein